MRSRFDGQLKKLLRSDPHMIAFGHATEPSYYAATGLVLRASVSR